MSSSSAIQVFVRVRPLLSHEQKSDPCLTVASDTTVLLDKISCVHDFHFDRIFNQTSSHDHVFESIQPVVESVLRGMNGCIFAYGQTGTGKTFTMMAGIVPRAVHHLMSTLNDRTQFCYSKVTCSCIEIYQERVHDLLDYGVSAASPSGLELRQLPTGEIVIPDALQIEADCEQEVAAVLAEGLSNRAVCKTNLNEHSSRSHTIFTMRVELRTRDNPHELRTAKLHLVDLAGSEKWRVFDSSEMSNRRVAEMTSINQSLSALGKCILALTSSRNPTHVPYRESKLTRLLQDSLGGNSRTAMIVTVSPASTCMDESLSSLQFAERAKKVQQKAVENVVEDDAAKIARLQQRVDHLESMLMASGLQSLLVAGDSGDDARVQEEIRLLRQKMQTVDSRAVADKLKVMEAYVVAQEDELKRTRKAFESDLTRLMLEQRDREERMTRILDDLDRSLVQADVTKCIALVQTARKTHVVAGSQIRKDGGKLSPPYPLPSSTANKENYSNLERLGLKAQSSTMQDSDFMDVARELVKQEMERMKKTRPMSGSISPLQPSPKRRCLAPTNGTSKFA